MLIEFSFSPRRHTKVVILCLAKKGLYLLLTLFLFMFRVCANNSNHPFSTDDLTILTDPFYAATDFHTQPLSLKNYGCYLNQSSMSESDSPFG